MATYMAGTLKVSNMICKDSKEERTVSQTSQRLPAHRMLCNLLKGKN